MTSEQLMRSGRYLSRAFDLLDRANECVLPIEAALVTKRGLLDEARRAVECARQELLN
ncbi:hypothetical protein [Magnetospirillum sp. 64-120]|uniref:hypothetical protein n=1 Tax=Magnetospirillum sp. 64-120 TaxID=1895778 RepID=UPI0025BE5692|nr:hypothetical protein [Magnetospirillum sp. 64-120]